MNKLLLLMMAVVLVGCHKENPLKPNKSQWVNPALPLELANRREPSRLDEDYLLMTYERALIFWYSRLVVCVHCSSDLVKKGAGTCAECQKDQREK